MSSSDRTEIDRNSMQKIMGMKAFFLASMRTPESPEFLKWAKIQEKTNPKHLKQVKIFSKKLLTLLNVPNRDIPIPIKPHSPEESGAALNLFNQQTEEGKQQAELLRAKLEKAGKKFAADWEKYEKKTELLNQYRKVMLDLLLRNRKDIFLDFLKNNRAISILFELHLDSLEEPNQSFMTSMNIKQSVEALEKPSATLDRKEIFKFVLEEYNSSERRLKLEELTQSFGRAAVSKAISDAVIEQPIFAHYVFGSRIMSSYLLPDDMMRIANRLGTPAQIPWYDKQPEEVKANININYQGLLNKAVLNSPKAALTAFHSKTFPARYTQTDWKTIVARHKKQYPLFLEEMYPDMSLLRSHKLDNPKVPAITSSANPSANSSANASSSGNASTSTSASAATAVPITPMRGKFAKKNSKSLIDQKTSMESNTKSLPGSIPKVIGLQDMGSQITQLTFKSNQDSGVFFAAIKAYLTHLGDASISQKQVYLFVEDVRTLQNKGFIPRDLELSVKPHSPPTL